MLKANIRGDLSLNYSGTEAMNTLCSNLLFAGHNIKKVLLSSCDANDGKSFVSIQIAAFMAERGKRVVLVDADLRCSVLLNDYSIDLEAPGMGLAHFLAGQAGLESCIYQTSKQNVYLIPIGNQVDNPMGLLSTKELGNMLNALAGTFDLVIVDAPPVGLVVDAAEIAHYCDGMIFVVEYDKTRKRDLKTAITQIKASGCPVLGCVLNKVTVDRLSARKYYSHYSSKYYSHYYNSSRNQKHHKHHKKDKDA